MEELFDSNFINKIQRLAIASKMTAAGSMGGNRKSRNKGSSVEFSDYREYILGDDFRRIDWNAYGRFEKLFIKLFMEEREASVNIYLDTSKSMDWGQPPKSFASRRLAAALGYMALSNYDRLSVYSIGSKAGDSRKSLRGKGSLAYMLEFLKNMDYGGETDINSAVEKCEMPQGRGISIVISDFFTKGPVEEMLKYLRYKKQEIYICHILAPAEIKPAINENVRLIDSETGEYIDITLTGKTLKAYGVVLKRFTKGIEEACCRRGANYMMADSALPVENILRGFV